MSDDRIEVHVEQQADQHQSERHDNRKAGNRILQIAELTDPFHAW
jgi:hypothetical protein